MSFDLPEGWSFKTLSECCTETISYGIVQPGKHDEKGVSVVRVNNFTQDGLDLADVLKVSPSISEKYKRTVLKGGEVLLTLVGSTGQSVVVPDSMAGWNVPRAIAVLRVSSDIGAEWVNCCLQSPITKHFLDARANTTVQKTLNLKDVKDIPIPVPPPIYKEQALNTLVSLAGKLENNRQINQTLEEMAQAIFKSWFVDFDPVKAKMDGMQPEGMDAATASLFPEKLDSDTGLPEGWKLSEIGDEVAVVGGGTPSKKNDDFWVDGHIHWTSPKDLSGVQDKVLLDTASKLTEAGLKKVSSGLLPVDTVLLSSRAPVGYLALAKVPLAVNQGYIAMKCEKTLSPEFVLQWCVHRMDEIKQRASGSTFAEISKKNFKPISVVVPSEDVLSAYQKLVKPLYDAITANVRQSEQLSNLRDTLLPKLLSGEVKLEQENHLTGALA